MQLTNNKTANFLFKVLAVFTVIYYFWLTFRGLLPNLVTRPAHLLLALPWVFFLYEPEDSKLYRLTGYLFGIIGIAFCGYMIINHEALDNQYGAIEGAFQWVLVIGLIIIVLEMARRKIKAALPIVACCVLAYAAFGTSLSGSMRHTIPFESTLGDLVLTEAGLWGMLTGVSVSTISIFIILGAAISQGKGGDAFMSLSMKLAGRYRAGAAKVSVMSSALFGSISGSASANVASTGTITIPSMKRQGYPGEFAAAVEATASTGGQIMPPLMGAGAFVMVELLSSTYQDIIQAALLPAILFFVACWLGVDFFARRYGIGAVDKSLLPQWKNVLKILPFFLIPFAVLLYFLFATTKTPQYGAAVAGLSAFVLLLHDGERFDVKNYISKAIDTCVLAAQQIAMMAAIIICVGIVIGVLNKLGLGVKIASMILSMSGGSLAIAILLTALTCLILGMEVPTTAAYVICIAVAEQTLLELGMPKLQSHMFVYWYALLSCITPPVCGTIFVAATMAKVSWVKVSSIAMRIGIGLYIIPLTFVRNPKLLEFGEHPLLGSLVALKVAFGIGCISAVLTGMCKNKLLALVLMIVGLALLYVRI